MLSRRKVLVGLQLVVALLLVFGTTPAFGDSPTPESKVLRKVDSTAGRLENDLEHQGFEVSRGYFKLYTNDECPTSYRVLHTCMGNNPAAPYVLPLVPPWPDEWVDPALIGAVGAVAEGYGGSFRFDQREAIVILGNLPPPASYFGLQTYLFTREGTYEKGKMYEVVSNTVPYLLPVLFSTVPNHQERVQLFATVGNSNNDVVVKGQSGAIWNQLRYFVITPDQSMDLAVRRTLSGIGVPAKDIFTEPIPNNLRLGIGESADDFLMLMRYAMPVDGGRPGTPSDRWRHQPPLVVMRVRDTRSGTQPRPYPGVKLDTRTATNEWGYQKDRGNLVAAVKTRWEQPKAPVTEAVNFQSQLLEVGPKCTLIGMNCLGDTQDNTVQMSRGRLWLDGDLQGKPQQVYAMVSTLATETGNATYVGLGLNDSLHQLGVGNVSDLQMRGSARGYGLGASDWKNFFVYYFTRDCTGLEGLTGGYCTSIPESMLPKCADPTDPKCVLLVFSLRDYIVPGTQRGPDAEQVLPAVVITLDRPQK